MILRFIGHDGDYGLINGICYPCKVYSKDNFITVRARSYALKFPRKHIYITYPSLKHMTNEWSDNVNKPQSRKENVRKLIPCNDSLNAMINEIIDQEIDKNFDDLILSLERWKKTTNVISCEFIINMIKIRKCIK